MSSSFKKCCPSDFFSVYIPAKINPLHERGGYR
jgi:hypothetical protein